MLSAAQMHTRMGNSAHVRTPGFPYCQYRELDAPLRPAIGGGWPAVAALLAHGHPAAVVNTYQYP